MLALSQTVVHDWFTVLAQKELALADTAAVLMRKDPPFDSEYFYATHLLQQAEREGEGGRLLRLSPPPAPSPEEPFTAATESSRMKRSNQPNLAKLK